ncbi:MAG: thioredoxin family protein [Xanthobacteraceae bacterium]|nr:thioredoxin family protein [Xanthobacteraceae bacterium]
MITRRQLFAALALVALVLSTATADALTRRLPFDQKAFAEAQAAGRPILVEFYTTWCPVCKVQRPFLTTLGQNPKYQKIAYFEIDFDKHKDLAREFRVHKQSTLIVFKGKNEVARSTGDTNKASIEALVAKSL